MIRTLHRPGSVQKEATGFIRLRWAWLLCVLAWAAIYPALANNIEALAYDAAAVHIYRGYLFSDAVSQGLFYPRWVQFLHWGLGSPLFTFQAPLPYSAMDFLYRLGVPHVLGWRLLMALGLAAACIGTYALVYSLTRQRWPAILGALAFVYAPYVLRDVFERGSTEALGVCLYPAVLWSLIWLAQRPSGQRFAAAAGLWTLCISTHVLAPLILAPVALVVAILLAWRRRTAAPLLALLAGGLLAAFIWLPMASEQSWVHVERDFATGYADPSQQPIPMDRLVAGPAIYDTQSDNNGTGDRLGLVHVGFLLAGLPALYLAWRQRRHDAVVTLGIALIIGWVVFWLLTGASDRVWQALRPLLQRLQYRSRLMGIEALASAVVAGVLLVLLPRRWQPHVGIVLAGLVILTALPSLYVELRHHYSAVGTDLTLAQVRQAEILSRGAAFTSFGEFQPRWRVAPFDDKLLQQLGPDFDAEKQPLAGKIPGVQVKTASVRAGKWDLDIQSQQSTVLTLHLLYYPRWQALIDGQPAALRAQAQTGYVQVDEPAGEHHVSLTYGTTPAEQAGLAVSGLTLAGLLLAAAWSVWQGRAKRGTLPAADHDQGEDNRPAPITDRAPSFWLLVILTGTLVFKVLFVDGATTWLRCQSTIEHVCDAQVTVDAPFTGGPRLRGYSVLDSSVKPGGMIRIQLFWQGEPGQSAGLSSFVHVRNSQKGWPMDPRSGSEIWAQENHPEPGGLLTTDFLPGKLYRDEYRVHLPADILPGAYFLEVGWYNPATNEQLEPQSDAVRPPLKILWRSILLPSIQVR